VKFQTNYDLVLLSSSFHYHSLTPSNLEPTQMKKLDFGTNPESNSIERLYF
jgi:hypothetical protein